MVEISLTIDVLLDELAACTTKPALQDFYYAYLGKKGAITDLLKQTKNVPSDERADYSQRVRHIKDTLQAAFEKKQTELTKQLLDEECRRDVVNWSYPAGPTQQGYMSLLVRERRVIEDLFRRQGYAVLMGSEVVTQYQNFESVNIPLTHPATDMQDNFYLDQTDEQGRPLLLRAHTSAAQVDWMRQLEMPIKTVFPGRVYRNEKMDATHDAAFWQVEGMVIDRGVTIANFKHALMQFLQGYFGDAVEMRLRPAYFPFVEPGYEVDGKLPGSSKRIELLGAGMIHPAVLREGGIDPEEYSGFAFGLGVNRMVTLKYKIDDVRLLTNGDLTFMSSFAGTSLV